MTLPRHVNGDEDGETFNVVEAIANHTLDAFLVTKAEPFHGPDGPEIVYVNPAFTQMTGYAPEEVLGKTPRILQTEQTDRAELDRIGRALARWQSVRGTLLNQTKDGTLFWVELDIVPIADTKGRYQYWISVQRDVTGRVENERRLQQQDKLRALGEMAGGMAHEINNALQPIVGSIGIIAERLNETDDKLAKHARVLERDVLHARKIVGDLLAFARSDTPETETHAVTDLLADVTDFISRVVPSNITLRRHGFPPDTPAVGAHARIPASRDGMIELLQNLVSNAADAMGGRGAVDIAVEAGHTEVAITVADTGPGMDAETRAQLFDPFFSTKPVGEGTGLGLSVAHGIVSGWGGRIDVDSAPDAGTRVAVRLPIVDAARA
jgi:PAS domain S-box-containing protein